MSPVRTIALKAALIYTAACSSSPVDPSPIPGPGPGQAPVAAIVLSAQQLTLQPGQTIQVTAMPRDAEGRPLADRQVTWTSSNEAAVVITNGNRITTVAAGTAQVRATAEGKSATVTITVVEVAPAVAELRTPDTELLVTLGTATFLDVVPVNAAGQQVPNVGISWVSTTPAVASITPGGAVMTHRPGVTTITASAGGKSVDIAVIVTPAPSTSPVVTYALGTVDGDSARAIIWSEQLEPTDGVSSWRVRRIMAATLTWDVVSGRYLRTYVVRSSVRYDLPWGGSMESITAEETIVDQGTVGHIFTETGVILTSDGTTWPPVSVTIGPDGTLAMQQLVPGGAGSKSLTYRPS